MAPLEFSAAVVEGVVLYGARAAVDGSAPARRARGRVAPPPPPPPPVSAGN